MARAIPVVMLIVGGIIFADIITHGSQFAQAMGGLQYVENPAIAGLLGQPPS